MKPTFSSDAYLRILRRALEQGYSFPSFLERPSGKSAYLRHDVDFSLHYAALLGRLNHSLGVRGTVCVLLRSHAYNAFSPSSLRWLADLRQNEQRIALHVPVPEPLPASDVELRDFVDAEFATLRRIVPDAEPIFAWHNPTAEIIERSRTWPQNGLLNTYSPVFQASLAYRSDSNLRHRPDDFLTFLNEGHERVHLLFHPLNWIATGDSMEGILATTWGDVLLEADNEYRLNRVYQKRFPEGLPKSLVGAWSEMVRKKLADDSAG